MRDAKQLKEKSEQQHDVIPPEEKKNQQKRDLNNCEKIQQEKGLYQRLSQ
jgi:hypothetical protein